MKAKIIFLFCSLMSCRNHDSQEPLAIPAQYEGIYSLQCVKYSRAITSHEPIVPYKRSFETTKITLGNSGDTRNLQSSNDSLSLSLVGNTFSFNSISNPTLLVSGGGYFTNDSLSYERIYSNRDPKVLYEEVCSCKGRIIK